MTRPEVDLGPPFGLCPLCLEPEWLDYNGHLNMAYYHVLADRCVDAFYDHLDVGEANVARTGHSLFTVSVHGLYRRELRSGDTVRVTMQLLALDDKRLRFYQTLHQAAEGWVAATFEQVALHVDTRLRRAKAFSNQVSARLAAECARHAALPWPDDAGQGIDRPAGRTTTSS